jgi:hypothetical protein
VEAQHSDRQVRRAGAALRLAENRLAAPRVKAFGASCEGVGDRAGLRRGRSLLLALVSFGVMGGPMQAQGHVQMAVRILCYDQSPQVASDAPVGAWFRAVGYQSNRRSRPCWLRVSAPRVTMSLSRQPMASSALAVLRLFSAPPTAMSEDRTLVKMVRSSRSRRIPGSIWRKRRFTKFLCPPPCSSR